MISSPIQLKLRSIGSAAGGAAARWSRCAPAGWRAPIRSARRCPVRSRRRAGAGGAVRRGEILRRARAALGGRSVRVVHAGDVFLVWRGIAGTCCSPSMLATPTSSSPIVAERGRSRRGIFSLDGAICHRPAPHVPTNMPWRRTSSASRGAAGGDSRWRPTDHRHGGRRARSTIWRCWRANISARPRRGGQAAAGRADQADVDESNNVGADIT